MPCLLRREPVDPGGCDDSLMKVQRKIGEHLAKLEQAKKAQRFLVWSNSCGWTPVAPQHDIESRQTASRIERCFRTGPALLVCPTKSTREVDHA
jgi:hypothetical protein